MKVQPPIYNTQPTNAQYIEYLTVPKKKKKRLHVLIPQRIILESSSVIQKLHAS